MSSEVFVNATSIIEQDFADGTCTKAVRQSVSQRNACTNQADEPGNIGKCGYTGPGSDSKCWQDLTIVDAKVTPGKGQALRRWLCDPKCDFCGFEEIVDVETCVTTSSPLGPPTAAAAVKSISCATGKVELTTFTNETMQCESGGKKSTHELGACVAGTWGTYEIWVETDSCKKGAVMV
jgi:hypothetical protein